MERYPSPKLAARMQFFYLKNSVKNRTRNVETRKISCTLETAGNIAKSSKFESEALLLDVLQGIIIGFKLNRKTYFCSKLNAIFKIVSMNFGGKFEGWVSYHSAVSQS